ncbi:MAG: fluoride efflux transporter CrcB [Pseudomonadota bacterium]
MLTRLIAIAAGGAIGAVLRFWGATAIYTILGREFPYGTLVVNVLGCLLMGFLYIFMLERIVSIEWRAALLIGLLGAFTTFSTFSLETLILIEDGEQAKALLNIFVSVSLCLLATWLGMQLARQL